MLSGMRLDRGLSIVIVAVVTVWTLIFAAISLTSVEAVSGNNVNLLSQNILLLAISMAAVMAVTLRFILHRLVLKPLTELSDAMFEIANGEVNTSIPMRHRRDQLGTIARSLEMLKANALKIRELDEIRNDQMLAQSQLLKLQKKFGLDSAGQAQGKLLEPLSKNPRVLVSKHRPKIATDQFLARQQSARTLEGDAFAVPPVEAKRACAG